MNLEDDVSEQLTEALLDQDQDFTIRRRIPRILVTRPSPAVVEGLLGGLEDLRFEVRFQCGLALSRVQRKGPEELTISSERILKIVQREVAVDRRIWESHRLLDQLEENEGSPMVDELIGSRADRGLEHVFTVLSLILPSEPLKIAFMGLHTDDATLKGTALEYLESVLPVVIRDKLWPFLEVQPTRKKGSRSRDEILDALLRSHHSMAVRLDELRQKTGE